MQRTVPVFTDSGASSPFSRTPGGKNSSIPQADWLVLRQRTQDLRTRRKFSKIMVILWLKTQDRCLTDSRANIRIPDLWFCWDKRSKCVTSKFVRNDRHIEFSAPKLAPLTYCWRFWPQTALILPMLVTRVKIKTARGWLWINLILFIRCLKIYPHLGASWINKSWMVWSPSTRNRWIFSGALSLYRREEETTGFYFLLKWHLDFSVYSEVFR